MIMIQSKATRGPWKFCPSVEGDFLGIYPSTGKMENPIAKMPEYVNTEINVANGRLIASAPDLVEVLEECAEYFDGRADADHDETGFVPNKEMRLLTLIQEALKKAGVA
jgi:hypothetical protein